MISSSYCVDERSPGLQAADVFLFGGVPGLLRLELGIDRFYLWERLAVPVGLAWLPVHRG